jgi:uncharacterized membrane protein YfcA
MPRLLALTLGGKGEAPMEGPSFWIAALAASVLVGMGKGGIPVVGMLGVPVLALAIPPGVAAAILLPVYVVSDVFGLWAYRHAFDSRVLAILMPGMVLGVAVGWATYSLVSEAAVTVLVGLVGAIFALNQIIRRPAPSAGRRAEVAPGLFWGAVTGFTSFVSHSGAPPYQVYTLPLGLPKMVYAGTATIAFAFVNAVKLVPYAALGLLAPANLKTAALLAPAAAAAVFLGVRLVRFLPEALFFRIVTWALLAISVRLILQGLRA